MTPHALIAPARLAGACVMRAQTDERLIDLIRAGNERAFEAVVERYRGPLLRHCRRFLPEGRAEDALQQTLVRAHAGITDDVRPLRLRPWLFRIATNASIDMLRQPGWAHEELDPEVDGMERPDQAFERSEDLRAAIAAVQDLPPRQRDAIVLRELEGRSYDEIASELGLSDGAVRQLLHRGRAGLRRAASALTPPWLLERVAAGAAELAGAGAPAGITKAVATVLAVGTVAGGVAVAPLDRSKGPESARAATDGGGAMVAEADPVGPARGPAGAAGVTGSSPGSPLSTGPGSAEGGADDGGATGEEDDSGTRAERREDEEREETRERTETEDGARTETIEIVDEGESRTREETVSPDGTTTETETRTEEDGSSETRTRTEYPDGTRVETRTETYADGTTTTETRTDGDSSGSGSSGSDSSGSGSSGSDSSGSGSSGSGSSGSDSSGSGSSGSDY